PRYHRPPDRADRAIHQPIVPHIQRAGNGNWPCLPKRRVKPRPLGRGGSQMKYSAYARGLAITGALGTAASLLLWATLATTGERSDWLIVAAIFCLPLLVTLTGLLRHSIRTAGWSAMLAVMYMAHGLAEYILGGRSVGLWLTLVFSGLLFAGCSLYPRLRSREGSAQRI